MIRRISTKWVLAVLAAVVIPFVGFAWFVNYRVSARMSGDVVRFHLLSMAADLADRIDEELDERRHDAELLAIFPLVPLFVEEAGSAEGPFRVWVQDIFDGLVRGKRVYDYVIATDASGRGVGMNTVWADGTPVPPEVSRRLLGRDYSSEPWFNQTMERGWAVIDFHRLDLGLGEGRRAGGYYVGFAHRIDPLANQQGTKGVVLTLMNWEHIQRAVSSYGVRQLAEEGEHLVGEDIYESSYAWMWSSDADTIIAHPNRDLYERQVSSLEGGKLVKMVEAARGARWGMFPRYEFQGIAKKAAFKHCKRPSAGGLGWVVGVGVDDKDIYAPVEELSNWLLTTSAVILGLAILFTFYIAHRTTRPIRELEQHTARVGRGDLDARIEVRSRDELGQLAASFNRMTAELKQNREQLVQAEKEAAWREMARQVAHEIKNPLTPISLSASLLRRCRDEQSPEFDAMLDRTIDMIQRQVEKMREVARDFYAFAGEHRDPRSVDVAAILDEVLTLNEAWAEDRGVRLHRPGSVVDGDSRWVRADEDELQRALLNLVTNAIEAMAAGGDLHTKVEASGSEVVVEIRDTGPGIPPEVEGRLFEPYFTTRSSGTGLGLAIVRRIVEDMGGRVELGNAPEGRGALARVVFPREPSPPE